MRYIGILGFIAMIGITLLVALIPIKYRKHLIFIAALFLFFFKTIEYTSYALTFQMDKIPVEFSTITYFVFSLTILFNLKFLKPFATFSAFISGTGYLLSFIFLGQYYFEVLPTFNATMAFIDHGLLFMASILMMRNDFYRNATTRNLMWLSAFYMVYALLVNYIVPYSDQYIFIRMLLSGQLIHYVLPSLELNAYMYMLYFLLIIGGFRLIIWLFHTLNKHIYDIPDLERTFAYERSI